MYKILTASSDNYITNKYVNNFRVKDANVGSAGTLDLFKLYNENPVKFVKTPSAKNSKTENMISLSSWQEIALHKGTTHGHD